MSKAFKEFKTAFDKYLDQVGIDEALTTATGMFVGLIEGVTEHNGHDASQQITVKGGGGSRDITIHPVKAT